MRSSAARTAPSSAGFSAVSYASSGPAVLEDVSIVTSSEARSYEDAHDWAGSARSCSRSATLRVAGLCCLRAARPGRRPAPSHAAAASIGRKLGMDGEAFSVRDPNPGTSPSWRGPG